MANLKSITELPIAESAEGLNLIVNDNGAAKQIAASAVGAQADFAVTDEASPAFIKNKPVVVQADWAEMDENSPAFVKNKPVEEWDMDITISAVVNTDSGNFDYTANINAGTFSNLKAKILEDNIPNIKLKIATQIPISTALIYEHCSVHNVLYMPSDFQGEGSPELVGITCVHIFNGTQLMLSILNDNSIVINS